MPLSTPGTRRRRFRKEMGRCCVYDGRSQMNRGTRYLPGRRGRIVAILGLALLVAFAGLTPAVSAKGKKKKHKPAAASTKTASSPLAAGGTATATASCTGKSHATGGGLSVAPNYVPSSNTGLRSLPLGNFPSGNKSWT